VGVIGGSGRGGEVGAGAAGCLAFERDEDGGGVGGEVRMVGAGAGVGELLDGEGAWGGQGGDEARGDDDFGLGVRGFGDGEAHSGGGVAVLRGGELGVGAWCGLRLPECEVCCLGGNSRAHRSNLEVCISSVPNCLRYCQDVG